MNRSYCLYSRGQFGSESASSLGGSCLAELSTDFRTIDAALADVRTSGQREVPSHLRDRHRPGSDAYGTYRYPHDYPEGWVEQRYLPEGLERGAFWKPAGRGWEEWRFEISRRDRTGHAPDVSEE